MARRRIGQEDLIARPEPRAASSLAELAALLDWAEIDRHMVSISAAVRGELGWPPLALFRGLLLATWHDLSDVRLADALDDRTSFRRFCGFAAHEPTPERTAFVRFRPNYAVEREPRRAASMSAHDGGVDILAACLLQPLPAQNGGGTARRATAAYDPERRLMAHCATAAPTREERTGDAEWRRELRAYPPRARDEQLRELFQLAPIARGGPRRATTVNSPSVAGRKRRTCGLMVSAA